MKIKSVLFISLTVLLSTVVSVFSSYKLVKQDEKRVDVVQIVTVTPTITPTTVMPTIKVTDTLTVTPNNTAVLTPSLSPTVTVLKKK